MIVRKLQVLGKGFYDHGAAVQISSARGIAATVDGLGREVVLVWLMDARGCPAVLMIDADTGASEEFPVPFSPGGSVPFACVLSSCNKFYTHFNSHFVEFDPVKKAFTAVHQTLPKVAISMTEDDGGRIWMATYPESGVAMYDPKTAVFRDYGSVYHQNWLQYQHRLAADDTGWIYFSVGKTLSQFVALNPETGESVPLLAEGERVPNVTSYLFRHEDGKVYGLANEKIWDGPWYELYQGKIKKMDGPVPDVHAKKRAVDREFPSGKQIKSIDWANRKIVIRDPATQTEKTLQFDYTSEGAHLMTLAAMPDGTIWGGCAFPMSLFVYNPKTESWMDWEICAQPNVLANQGGCSYVGGYTRGVLLEWNSDRPLVSTRKDSSECNPRVLTQCTPAINRPHILLADPDGQTLIMAGSPEYGYTGGGMLFWDRKTGSKVLLEHTELLPDQSVMSLLPLADGKLFGGTGTRAGTGGEVKAAQAELFVIDKVTKKIDWHQAVFPGAQEYSELCMGPQGLVFGLVSFTPYDPNNMDEMKRFFVFDPVRKMVIHQEMDTEAVFGPVCLQQGQRKLILSPAGDLYVLFRKGIAQVDPVTFKLSWLAMSPVSIDAGGDWVDGKIYFAAGSHLYSYQITKPV